LAEGGAVTDWTQGTISDVAPAVARGEVSPVELTRACLERIEALEPRLHAFITVRPGEALADARRAEEEIRGGRYRGPLHGLPLSVKDNIAAAGWPTTNGSRLAADFVTDYDATLVAKLRQAGAVLVGKNNMHEWAMGGTSWGGPFGSVRNPWNLACIAGGSSGGSAASVSASLVFASFGNDGMGSVRNPASLCGVVGLKPTRGLVGRFGELPATSSQMHVLGPLAKCVRDAAALLNATAGYDPQDPTSLKWEPRDYVAELEGGVRGLRIGVPEHYFLDDADPEVKTRVEGAIRLLEHLGARTRPVSLPSVAYAYKAFPLIRSEALSYQRRFLESRRDEYADKEIMRRLLALNFVLAPHAQLALQVRTRIRREFAEVLREVDVLATPTVPVPAFPGDPDAPEDEETRRLQKRPLGLHRLLTRLTVPFNFSGMPAISVPCGFTSDGLPIGLQLAGRLGEDGTVLRAAYTFEQMVGVGYRRPPLIR
jgi:aspartyl-tRNA(Asn)/glutamyl-tRNA(Gln) amidotransferase subunit A